MDEKLRREMFQEYLSARQLNQIPDTLSFDDYINKMVDQSMALRDEAMMNKGGRIGFQAGTTGTVGMSKNRVSQLLDIREDLIRAGEDVSDIDAELFQMGFTPSGPVGYNMGGPVGYNMGGRMNYQEGGPTEMAMMQNPNPQMASRSANSEAGIAAALANERDPNKKINMAIQILQSMGEKGINIIKSSLSPDELQMLQQKIQGVSEQGVGSINTPQMAANGGRMGYQNGMMVASADPDTNPDDRLLDDPEGTFNTNPDEVMKLIDVAMPGANPSDVQEAYDRAVLQGFEGSILEFIMIMGGDRRDLGDDMGANPQGIMSMMRA